MKTNVYDELKDKIVELFKEEISERYNYPGFVGNMIHIAVHKEVSPSEYTELKNDRYSELVEMSRDIFEELPVNNDYGMPEDCRHISDCCYTKYKKEVDGKLYAMVHLEAGPDIAEDEDDIEVIESAGLSTTIVYILLEIEQK